MSKTISIKVICEPYDDGALTCDMATAHVEGLGVRGIVEVPALGHTRQDKLQAMAAALIAAGEKLAESTEPAAYTWRREIEDTHGPDTLLGCKAGR